MSNRNQGRTQEETGAKAGLSERSARRIERGEAAEAARREPHWRTRKDPFVEVWDSEILPRLEQEPKLHATTLFEDFTERYEQLCAHYRMRPTRNNRGISRECLSRGKK